MRVVHTEAVLWVPALRDLAQQALAQRLRTLPAELFSRVLPTILPLLQGRWQARQRPLPPAVAWAYAHVTAVVIADGSTLDGLLRKIGLLQDALKAPLAGRMMALLDWASRLPRRVWYDADALELTRLPTVQAVALYPQRWRVEEGAFQFYKGH